jgi:hypothetical protein
MNLTPHIITGLLIAKNLPDPFLSVPFALLSHYALDIIPHEPKKDIKYPIPNRRGEKVLDPESERRFWKISVFDGMFSLALIIFYFINNHPAAIINFIYFLIIITAGILPDILNTIGMYFPNKFFHFFAKIHHQCHLITGMFLSRKVSFFIQYFFSLLIYCFFLL